MKKALFIISGKAKYIPDLIHIHIQDHGKLINGEFGGVIIVCEFFNRSLQVFYLGYQIVVTEFLLCLFLNGMKDPLRIRPRIQASFFSCGSVSLRDARRARFAS